MAIEDFTYAERENMQEFYNILESYVCILSDYGIASWSEWDDNSLTGETWSEWYDYLTASKLYPCVADSSSLQFTWDY